MTFGGEPLTRYAASTTSGATPSFMKSGTNTGAMMDQFAKMLGTGMLDRNPTAINPDNNGTLPRFAS
jgi:hypothetical protein